MKLTLTSQQHKDRVIEYLKALDISKPMLLAVTEKKKNRSMAQKGLYFSWVTTLAGEEGLSKEESHLQCKERFLKPIYIRDKPEIAELYDGVRTVYRNGDKELALMMNKRITSLISTNDADVKQFTEFLEQIDLDAMQRGIFLERPDDMYREAMNK